jgi:hypothetical protein
MKAHRLCSAAVDRATGVVCDQTIVLDGHYVRIPVDRDHRFHSIVIAQSS